MNRGVQWLVIGVIVLSWSVQGLAAAPKAPKSLTRQQAMSLALSTRPAIKAAQAREAAASSRAVGAASAWYPRLDISTSVTHGLSGATGALGIHGLAASPYKDLWGGSLNLSWIVYDFNRRSHHIDAAARERLAQSLRVEVAKQDIVASTALLFDRCIRMEQEAVSAAELVRSRTLSHQQAKAFLAAGLRSEVDVQLANVNLLRAQREATQAESRFRLGKLELLATMGVEGDDVYLVSESVASGMVLLGEKEAIQRALAQRPEAKVLSALAEAADERGEAVSSGHWPEIRLSGSVGYSRMNQGFVDAGLVEEDAFYAVGVGVEIPIFEGFHVSSQVDAHRSEARALRESLRDLQLTLRRQVQQAYHEVRMAAAELPAAEAEREQANVWVQHARSRYEARVGTVVDLAEAESSLATARLAVARAKERIRNAQIRLEYASGELSKKVRSLELSQKKKRRKGGAR